MTEPTELERAVARAIELAIVATCELEDGDEISLTIARAAIDAIHTAGFAVVPIKPTEKMLDEAEYEEVPSSSDGEDCNLTIRECGIGIPRKVWDAMIAAAPKP